MPASTPLLDALKAEKSAQRDKEAIQRNHAHYKDAAHASKKDESKKKAGAGSGSTSEAKQSGESAAPLGNEPRGGPQLQPRRRRPLSLAPRRSRSPETHPPLHPRSSRIGGCFFESPDGRRCRCACFCGRVCSCSCACAGEL